MEENPIKFPCSISIDETTGLPKIIKNFNDDRSFGDISVRIYHTAIYADKNNFLFTNEIIDHVSSIGAMISEPIGSGASLCHIIEVSRNKQVMAQVISTTESLHVVTRGSALDLQDTLLDPDIVDILTYDIVDGWKNLARFCKKFEVNPLLQEGRHMLKSTKIDPMDEDSAQIPVMYVFDEKENTIQAYVSWKLNEERVYPGSFKRFLCIDEVWEKREDQYLRQLGNYKLCQVNEGYIQDKTKWIIESPRMSAIIRESYAFNLSHTSETIRGYITCTVKNRLPASNFRRGPKIKESYSIITCKIPEGHKDYLDSILESLQGASNRLVRSFLTPDPLKY